MVSRESSEVVKITDKTLCRKVVCITDECARSAVFRHGSRRPGKIVGDTLAPPPLARLARWRFYGDPCNAGNYW